MKQFEVVFANENGDINTNVLDLVNINNPEDKYLTSPDHFKVGEIVNENEIYLKECQYTDDNGFGKGVFAFKNKHESN